MTHLEYALKNRITPLVRHLASKEAVTAGFILSGLKNGRIVIPHNNTRRIKNPCAIGTGLSTKINANLGTSTDKFKIEDEIKKLRVAVKYGADTVMDLSVGGDIRQVRRKILDASEVPVGTVPIYEIAVNARKKRRGVLNFTASEILEVLEEQAKEGVDFFTIHSGVTRKSVSHLTSHKRLLGIVSRGGAILASWMIQNKKENPFYEYFDRILDIAYKYDVTLSLGDGLRPGSILDASDAAQFSELKILGELAKKARKKNVQVMIEGPGHVPIHLIKENILLEKKLCHGAPFYVLGPLVTDVAAGYDHITSSIGGAIAASFGADFLCYVTPSEHLRLPSIEDVREGVIASKIAAHAADIAKGLPGALQWDIEMSKARSRRDWKQQIKLSIDPEKAKAYRLSSRPVLSDVCTMCGEYCSIKMMESCLRV